MKSLVCLSALAVLAPFAAQAQEASPITANVSVTTKYKFRGQDQGNSSHYFDPAIQGGFDFSKNGFYVGNWNSSIGGFGGTESDIYGGYKAELAKDLTLDVGALHYWYRDTIAKTTELYVGLNYSFLSVKYSGTVSSDYFGYAAANTVGGKGRGTGYLDVAANYELQKGLTLNAHVGYTRMSSDLRDAGVPSYTDYKLGLTYDLGSGFSASGAFVGANKKDVYGDVNKGRVIFALSKAL